jgi:hypothetical protein
MVEDGLGSLYFSGTNSIALEGVFSGGGRLLSASRLRDLKVDIKTGEKTSSGANYVHSDVFGGRGNDGLGTSLAYAFGREGFIDFDSFIESLENGEIEFVEYLESFKVGILSGSVKIEELKNILKIISYRIKLDNDQEIINYMVERIDEWIIKIKMSKISDLEVKDFPVLFGFSGEKHPYYIAPVPRVYNGALSGEVRLGEEVDFRDAGLSDMFVPSENIDDVRQFLELVGLDQIVKIHSIEALMLLKHADSVMGNVFNSTLNAVTLSSLKHHTSLINYLLMRGRQDSQWKRISSQNELFLSLMDGDVKGDQKFNQPSMEEIEGPSGSTPAKWYQDSDGNKYLFKFYGSPHKVVNEIFYSNMYKFLGFGAPEASMGIVDGKWALVSKGLEGVSNANNTNNEIKSEIDSQKIQGFMLDCLFANWDAPQNDNILYRINGSGEIEVIRVDNGGAGVFRAADYEGVSRLKSDVDFGSFIKEFETFFQIGGYKDFAHLITDIEKIRQGEIILSNLTPEIIDKIYFESGMDLAESGFSRKTNEILKQRLEHLRQYVQELKNKQEPSVENNVENTDSGLLRSRFEKLLFETVIDDKLLTEIIPEWSRFIGEAGFQHNKVLLGEHVKKVIKNIRSMPEFLKLSEKEQKLLIFAAFFHDFGKPTGKVSENVLRNFDHDVLSVEIAKRYLEKFGFSKEDIRVVELLIAHDGVVTDIVRGKVHDGSKKMTPLELADKLDNNTSIINLLRLLNRADALDVLSGNGFWGVNFYGEREWFHENDFSKTVGVQLFYQNEKKFNDFYDEMLRIAERFNRGG